jgi:hypothetical protein
MHRGVSSFVEMSPFGGAEVRPGIRSQVMSRSRSMQQARVCAYNTHAQDLTNGANK